MPRPARETIMEALFSTLTGALQKKFSADTAVDSTTLANPTIATGLFVGLPVFGPGIKRGSVITSLSPLTISQPATANAVQAQLTSGFLTTGRRLKPWNDVQAQPALFTRDGDEDLNYEAIILQQQTILVDVWIYSNAGQDPDAVPVIALNNILDAVQAALAPDAMDTPTTGRFTLGNLVHWCRISGRVMKSPGDLDGQAIAVVPIEIIVP